MEGMLIRALGVIYADRKWALPRLAATLDALRCLRARPGVKFAGDTRLEVVDTCQEALELVLAWLERE